MEDRVAVKLGFFGGGISELLASNEIHSGEMRTIPRPMLTMFFVISAYKSIQTQNLVKKSNTLFFLLQKMPPRVTGVKNQSKKSTEILMAYSLQNIV